jgi:hypothetical protein
MKLCLGALGVLGTVLLTAATGCGPGLGHHGQFAKAPDAVSTTSLTSEEMPLPSSRMPVAREFDTGWEDPWADEKSDANPKLQTWGESPKPEDRYGF